MNTGHAEYRLPDELLREYVRKTPKLRSHYISMMQMMESFINEMGYSKKDVQIDRLGLGYALVDYFEDVRRMKEYHKCAHINSIKIVSYLSYWLVKRRVIVPLRNDKELLYLNEQFVLSMISVFLSSTNCDGVLEDDREGLENFRETFFYYLKYRVHDAHDIEMIITAFFAGRIYQASDDLSAVLPESDNEIREKFPEE